MIRMGFEAAVSVTPLTTAVMNSVTVRQSAVAPGVNKCGGLRGGGASHRDPGDIDSAVDRTDYQERTYYFCAHACRQEFDRDPENYVASA